MAAAAIFFLKDQSLKLIRSLKIPREQFLPNLNAIQPTVHTLSCPQALRRPSWKMAVYGAVPSKKYISEE